MTKQIEQLSYELYERQDRKRPWPKIRSVENR